jgi:hypothetical protein
MPSLTSLLYKKHPAVKFVLVDPKKVELTLLIKMKSQNYLPKLPDTKMHPARQRQK